ncbi:MAG: PhnA domain-containing protein [Planctomycetaceae bacterium]|nr:PhnA domain-containing protein [Planctomycetaceae bacterium]
MLQSGDSVTVTKDLKVKNNRLVDSVGDHDIDC